MGTTLSCFACRELNLFTAVRTGRTDQLLRLVHDRPELIYKSKFSKGETIWHIGVQYGQLAMLKALATELLDSNAISPSELRALLGATNYLGQTPIMYACLYGRANCIPWLLDQGANPWLKDVVGGRTAMHLAVLKSNCACIHALLSHPLTDALRQFGRGFLRVRLVDMTNDNGLTPLHFAVSCNVLEVVQTVLQYMPKLICKTTSNVTFQHLHCFERGSTPLHISARRGNAAVCMEILRSHVQHQQDLGQVDPRVVRDSHGKRPYKIAEEEGFQDLARVLAPRYAFDLLFAGELQESSFKIPSLKSLAAVAVQRFLMGTLDALELASGISSGVLVTGIESSHDEGPTSSEAARLTARHFANDAGPCGPYNCTLEVVNELEPINTQDIRMPAYRGKYHLLTPAASTSTTSLPLTPAGQKDLSFASDDLGPLASGLNYVIEQEFSDIGEGLSKAASCVADVEEEQTQVIEVIEDEQETGDCEICFDRINRVQVISCGHKLCVSCARGISMLHETQPASCPFCRGVVRGFRPC